MDANPFSIESILKKSPSSPSVEEQTETQPSKSSEALSLAVKIAGKLQFNTEKYDFLVTNEVLSVVGFCLAKVIMKKPVS